MRSRLVDRLGTNGDRANLALVYGSAGSGKSTLLAQWAAGLPLENEDLVWVTLNPDDAGALPFWLRIGGSLIRHGLLDEDTPFQTPSQTGALLEAFAGLRAPLTLVLDDYHLVASEPIDAQLRLLVEKIGLLRLVIGSRATNGLHSLELAARVSTVFIDADALAFTLDESEALVAASSLRGNSSLATTIQSAALGWPLATQALLVEAQRDPDQQRQLSRLVDQRSRFVTEFARSQLATRDVDAREFLLRIALANECTVSLAAELGGRSQAEAAAQLEQLETDGIGTWQARAGDRWFRLHPLLQEALEVEAGVALDPSDSVRLRGLLSDRLQWDRPLRAFELAFAIEDWDRMERLALLHWLAFSYYLRGPTTELLRRVPLAAMREHPAMFAAELVQSYGDARVSLDQLLSTFGTVTAAMRNRQAAPGVVGALTEVMYMGLNRIFGEMDTALRYADRTHAMLAQSTAADRQENAGGIPIVYAQTAITYLIDTQYVRAQEEASRGRRLAEEVGSIGERFQTLGVTALIHAVRGDITQARRWIAVCEAADPHDGWLGGYLQAGYHIAKAFDALNRWDTAAARLSVDALDPHEPVIEYWPYIAIIRAQADLITAGPAQAHATLADTLARKRWRPKASPQLRGQLAATQAQLLLLSGQPARAAAVLDQAELEDHPAIDLVRARLAALQARSDQAIAIADAVAWASTESPQYRAEAQLTVAVIAYEAGQSDRAAETFLVAMSTLEQHSLRLPLLTVPRERLEDLTTLVAERGHVIDSEVIEQIPIVARLARRVQVLSGAELRVLRAFVDNDDVATAAASLHLSVHTVRYHLKRSYPKLGVTTRADAVALVQELGLL